MSNCDLFNTYTYYAHTCNRRSSRSRPDPRVSLLTDAIQSRIESNRAADPNRIRRRRRRWIGSSRRARPIRRAHRVPHRRESRLRDAVFLLRRIPGLRNGVYSVCRLSGISRE